MILASGYYLHADEAHALRHLSARRVLWTRDAQWGTDRVLGILSTMGLASKCGRVYHANGHTDRVAAALPAELPA